ncbi:LURP-one-related family protein [Ureibacillus sp. FSL W7-1570]|uniref:LURP-one-related/scramblase family protein n=1 Tax=Ureibacillus sp. FSL W7-1570 TaxID=2954593 RepID=UPI003159F64C
MKQLYIKQKFLSLTDRFKVKDEQGNEVYYVEGSFLKIPKTFTIYDMEGHEVAVITKKVFAFLPKFIVEMEGRQVITIKKEFTFFRSRYTIDAAGIEVRGNWWDMTFQVFQHGEKIGQVSKEWFTWGDSYKVEILNEEMEQIIIALVIAIDCVKEEQSTAAAASSSV